MRYWIFSVTMGITLAGCAQVEGLFDRQPDSGSAASEARATPDREGRASDSGEQIAPGSDPALRTAEDFDTTTQAQRTKAVDAAQATGGATDLGLTIASLGAPTEPGFWLKTPLADRPGKGRVDYPARGTSVVVDLIPLDALQGSGSQISLAAMRLIEADLTGLPELRVFRLPE